MKPLSDPPLNVLRNNIPKPKWEKLQSHSAVTDPQLIVSGRCALSDFTTVLWRILNNDKCLATCFPALYITPALTGQSFKSLIQVWFDKRQWKRRAGLASERRFAGTFMMLKFAIHNNSLQHKHNCQVWQLFAPNTLLYRYYWSIKPTYGPREP